jgi:N-acetylmuramoyl-L-alanine amidase
MPIYRNKINVKVFLFLCIFFSCASSPITETVGINKLVLIIIDPGHGGSDNGAVVDYQISDEIITFREKVLTLKIARLLAERLNKKLLQAQIVLTRTDDVFLSLEERVVKVNQISTGTFNTVFVSIHINYSLNKDAFGLEVYYYIPALLDPDAFITVQYLKETLRQNMPFAESILNAIGSVPELESLPHSMKSGDYYVLRNTSVPAVLIECGFLSNEKEAHLLNSVPYQEKLAEAIALGIENYLKENRD